MGDLSITATEVLPGTGMLKKTGTAGETVTAGQPVYIDTSDSNKLKLADTNSSLTTATAVGIALHASSDGQPLDYAVSGKLTLGASASVVEGEVYLVSGTAGGIMAYGDLANSDYTCLLGIGNGNDLVLAIKQGRAQKETSAS